MLFSHIADCHIGSWREPKMNHLSTEAFEKAINISIEKKVDFVIIAGDLFNTPLPAIDKLKSVVIKLKELKDRNIPVYGIPGSHDFSPSGKTMIDVLESAGLFNNVCKGKVIDERLRLDFADHNGLKITGMIGKKGMLEHKFYEQLDFNHLEQEKSEKIFVFHTMISQLKPTELHKMDSTDMSLLPKGFNYYAGGHPHIVSGKEFEKYGKVYYPGPLFPNNFYELSKLKNGGFYLVKDFNPEFVPIRLHETLHININADHMDPNKVEEEIKTHIKECKDTIVTIKVAGTLETGKRNEIDFKSIFDNLYEKGAYFVMKNTNQLQTKEFEQVKIEASDADDVEQRLIDEHMQGPDKQLVMNLIQALTTVKLEGEKVADFEDRLSKDIEKVFEDKI